MGKKPLFIFIIVMLMIATACNFPFFFSDAEDKVSDAIEETVNAVLTQTEAAATYTPLPTFTPLPTYTPYPSHPSRPKPRPSPYPCNQAQFISETVKDNTEFDPGESFTKSWRLKNTGTCTWNPDYRLAFYSGDRMDGPKYQDLNEYVEPGETIDLLIDLKAPEDAGNYTGYWKLQADDGDYFYQVYAQIEVEGTFAVTGVSLDADPSSYTGACPAGTIVVDMDADISSSGAGKVTYRWEASNGVTSDWYSKKFSGAGTETVSYDWSINITADETFTIRLYVDNPNHQYFGPLDFEAICTPAP